MRPETHVTCPQAHHQQAGLHEGGAAAGGERRQGNHHQRRGHNRERERESRRGKRGDQRDAGKSKRDRNGNRPLRRRGHQVQGRGGETAQGDGIQGDDRAGLRHGLREDPKRLPQKEEEHPPQPRGQQRLPDGGAGGRAGAEAVYPREGLHPRQRHRRQHRHIREEKQKGNVMCGMFSYVIGWKINGYINQFFIVCLGNVINLHLRTYNSFAGKLYFRFTCMVNLGTH